MKKIILGIIAVAVIAAGALLLGQADAGSKDSASVTYVDAAEARTLLKDNPDYVVLDVRTKEEFDAGHIAGAVNVDYKSEDFKNQLTRLDTSKTYVVHCEAGGRSSRSLTTLKELGFDNLVHMDGGMRGWRALDDKGPKNTED